MNNAVELINVSKAYKRAGIFENVNLEVKEGETVGIIGSNGSGKSVLFKLICGLERSDSGEIFIRNEKLGESFDFPDNVGALINEPGYIDYYPGFKNLQMLAGIKNKIEDEKIERTMESVGLDPNNKDKVKHYSMGMKQKLGIAQAIMEDQDIIILDEPFNALDFKTSKEIKNIILRLKEKGITILLTSHNHADIKELCDRTYILMDRKILELTNKFEKEYFA